MLEKKIKSKNAVIGAIGLGYIGLTLLDAFGKAGFALRGFDLVAEKIDKLNHKEEIYSYFPLNFLYNLIEEKKFQISTSPDILKDADVIIISVSTSLDEHRIPDLTNLRLAFQIAHSVLKKGQLIILQSSTFPGTTEEELLSALQESGLQVGKDFYLSYVPEMTDIGNTKYSFVMIPRIVSGITPECLKMASLLYTQIGCQIVPCSSTKVAESAKLLQNSFRLVNISFINEMKIMFDRLGIDIWKVIDAAASKPFGFIPFYPSAGVGGDCIPTDPFYLVWKANATDGPTKIIEEAGHINDTMPLYVVNKMIPHVKKNIHESKILVLGVGYKKDVNDIRNSAGVKVLSILKKMEAHVFYHDPFVPELDLGLRSIDLVYEDLKKYDAIIIITDHSVYDWKKIAENSQLIVDTKNVITNKTVVKA